MATKRQPKNTPDIRRVKLTDLRPDTNNANKGTERGLALLDDSISEDGLGRGVLLDQDLSVIAGNKTLERAIDDGFEDVIIVPTDGRTLVATQRIDVSIDSPKGRRMALRDNRVAELDLDWDADALLSYQELGVELSDVFNDDELAELLDIQANADASSPDQQSDDPSDRTDYVFFRFGNFHSLVSKALYKSFEDQVEQRKKSHRDGQLLLDDVLRDWLHIQPHDEPTPNEIDAFEAEFHNA